MQVVLASWIKRRLEAMDGDSTYGQAFVALLGSRLEWAGIRYSDDFLARAQRDTASYFDAIESLLRVHPPRYGWPRGADISDLELALAMAGSAWTLGPSKDTLTLRVDDTAVKQVTEAAVVSDDARAHLVEAWNSAFGRHPNASDAWDHSIKAVEAIYVPLVDATNPRASLGTVARELKQRRSVWEALVVVDDNDPSQAVELIESMCRAVWGNPDRHAGNPNARPLDQTETEAVVQIAVTLVQWGRQGVLRKVEP